MALKAGLIKGGAAKGELILAIFELANCFRNGWGIPRDPVAAKQVGRFLLPCCRGAWVSAVLTGFVQYYETAANLGDTGEYPIRQHPSHVRYCRLADLIG
jgi:hypothetical protein